MGTGIKAQQAQILQQLGITYWALRCPAVFQGETGVLLPADCLLLLIAQQPVSSQEPLLQDILRALRISPQQICLLREEQLPLLPTQSDRVIWYLGTAPVTGLSERFLASASWQELKQSAAAKQALWQQICQYETDLFPVAG